MILVISIIIGYIISGISHVANDLNTRPIDRPGWAHRPTAIKAVLAGILWFMRPILDTRFKLGRNARGTAFGLMVVFNQLFLATIMVYGCIHFSTYLVANLIGQIILSAVFIWFFGFIALSFMTLLFLPIATLMTFILSLFFAAQGVRGLLFNRYTFLGSMTGVAIAVAGFTFLKNSEKADATLITNVSQPQHDTAKSSGQPNEPTSFVKNEKLNLVKSTLINSVEIYKNSGIAGLVVHSQDCYGGLNQQFSLNDLKACALIDMLSHELDSSIKRKSQQEAESYFSVESFQQRIGPSLKALGLTRDQANKNLLSWEQDLRNLIKEITAETT